MNAYYKGHKVLKVYGYYGNVVMLKTEDKPFVRAELEDVEIVEE